ncbi:MAG: hypothetical protein KIT32_12070 [Rhodocyclaceae bacterium]|nr:hypothetical protein [Rhodocyclaceae bacterium]
MSEQPSLLDWKPPEPFIARGATFVLERDGIRLGEQAQRVFNVMRDGKWHTLSEVERIMGDPQASISARFRDFRRFGFTVEREFIRRGQHRYRLA